MDGSKVQHGGTLTKLKTIALAQRLAMVLGPISGIPFCAPGGMTVPAGHQSRSLVSLFWILVNGWPWLGA